MFQDFSKPESKRQREQTLNFEDICDFINGVNIKTSKIICKFVHTAKHNLLVLMKSECKLDLTIAANNQASQKETNKQTMHFLKLFYNFALNCFKFDQMFVQFI